MPLPGKCEHKKVHLKITVSLSKDGLNTTRHHRLCIFQIAKISNISLHFSKHVLTVPSLFGHTETLWGKSASVSVGAGRGRVSVEVLFCSFSVSQMTCIKHNINLEQFSTKCVVFGMFEDIWDKIIKRDIYLLTQFYHILIEFNRQLHYVLAVIWCSEIWDTI